MMKMPKMASFKLHGKLFSGFWHGKLFSRLGSPWQQPSSVTHASPILGFGLAACLRKHFRAPRIEISCFLISS